MLVRRGANTPMGREKFDVEVDETDLHRMLAERGAANPAEVAARMVTHHVFLVLDHEAMAFLHRALVDLEPQEKAAHSGKVRWHRAERDKYLAIYLPPPAEEPAGATA